MSTRALVLGALISLLSAPIALADPAGRSTTDETIRPDGSGAFTTLRTRTGEDHGIRRPPGLRADGSRARRRAARWSSSASSPIRRSPTRCHRRGWTSSTPRAGRAARRGAPRRRSACRSSTRRPQHERQPDERAARRRQAGQAGLRDHDRRPRRQPAAQRDALVQGRARRRPGRPVQRQAGQRHEPVPGLLAGDGRRAQRRGRRPAIHGRRRLRRLPRRPRRSLRRLLGSGRRRARARTRPSPATRACSNARRARSPPRACGCRGTSPAATTTG